MSIQLILFPQNYSGQYNAISSSATEAVVNGINFAGVGSSSSYDSPAANPPLDTLTNAPPSIVNTWYRYRSTSLGTPALPTVTGGNLVLNSTTTLTQCGVYQRLTNLTIGQQYTVAVNISVPPATGLISIDVFNGTTYNASTTPGAATPSQNTVTFTADATNNTILIAYVNTSADNITISSISVQPTGTTPNLNIYDLENGQVIVDLYEDEDIPLTLSVDEFKNVAEQVKSYSKAFNLPATKRNNQIFDNIFEVTRADDGIVFNPYVKTQCQLKQDGFILFEGYLRLIDIQDKEGEISYDVNLYSEVIALADVLGERTFSELDFSELTHDYNYTEIRNSWQGILALNSPLPVGTFAGTAGASITDVLRYPFVDWNHSYTYDPSTGFPILPNLESSFRPFISIKYLIQNIFAATPFSYTSDFIDNDPDFQKLYMDFNWGSDNAPVVFNSSGELTKAADFNIPTSYTTLNFDEMNFPLVGGNALNADFGYSAGVFTAQENGQVYTFTYDMEFNQTLSVDTLSVQWLVNGVPVDQATSTSISFNYAGNFTTGVGSIPTLSAGDTVLCQAESPLGLYDLDGVLNPGGTTPSLVTITTSVAQTTTDTLLGTLRGELGQWDFLKGIMTMFNLVSVPDKTNPNNILIEPYNDIFLENSDSTQLDWTDKIDIAEMKLTPLTDLNKKTIFKFVEDDDDYAFNVYKNSAQGHLYGSKVFDASGFTVLEGEEEIIAEPFAATVPKPLMTQFPDFIVPSIYSYNPDDDTSEGFDNSPRIMYNNGVVDLNSCTYFVPCQNQPAPCGDATEDQFLQFNHIKNGGLVLSDYADFHFGMCQLVGNITGTTNNLFNTYWLPYFNELYNADTRTMTIKVNLTPGDINTFKFYDTVFIKNREFRVNKIDYKPNDLATVEFILIP